MSHALLSPSAAYRWMACPPSARLEEQFPDGTSTYAEEGTHAHACAELRLRMLTETDDPERLPEERKRYYLDAVDELAKSPYHSADLADHVIRYTDYVREQYLGARANTPDAVLAVETRLDLTAYVPGGYGTADAVIIADGTMYVLDLKFGRGVAVSAEHNPQAMIYGLGALEQFGALYDISRVVLCIHQPRLDSVSEWETSAAELRKWGDEVLRPAAALAHEGGGAYAAGDHCRFCRAKARCRALAEQNLDVARYEFRDPALLADEEVADVLDRSELLRGWADAVKAYAQQMLMEGGSLPGYKLVEGRSVRRYTDEAAVAAKLIKAGYAEDLIYDRSVKGITALEKAITKKAFAEELGDLVVKPAGAPTLVKDTDPRPAWSSAVNDFSNL